MAFLEGDAVNIIAGTHKGKKGRVKRCTAQMVEIWVDGDEQETVKVMQKSVEKAITTNVATVQDESREPSGGFSVGDSGVAMSAGTCGANSSTGGTCEDSSTGAAQALAYVVGAVVKLPFQGLYFGGQAVAKIVLGKQKEDTFFLKWLFGPGLLEVNPPSLEKTEVHINEFGETWELCASKIDSDGKTWMGKQKEVVRLFYARVDDSSQANFLQARLDRVAAFSELRDPCKLASRLELLLSSASSERQYERPVTDFEIIDEPQPSIESGGCGFIPEHLLLEMLGSGIKAKRVSAIQLPPSMRKVGPSTCAQAGDDWAWLLITRDYPSSNNLQIGKWVSGGTPCKSFAQKALSPMLMRLLKSLGVPSNNISAYASRGHLRKEAWVVGAADPTNSLPASQVFVSGFNKEQVPCVDGHYKVFVTRSPCTTPDDGRLLQVVNERPPAMSIEDWDALLKRPLGDILFSNQGSQAIPETISDGDLDGDLYWICWNEDVVKHIAMHEMIPAAASADRHKKTTGSHKALGCNWLRDAREYMLSDNAMKTKRLIGKLYRAGEEVADKSEQGLHHPDAKAYFRAYAQAIDAGKHGNKIDLPEHLRAKVGM